MTFPCGGGAIIFPAAVESNRTELRRRPAERRGQDDPDTVEPLKDFQEFERYIGRFTNYERVVHFDYDRKTLGPHRVEEFCAELGHPQVSYRTLHVAGTKGKGSTCLMIEALLRAEGWRVGTYLSPHVEHLRERIRLDGQPIAEKPLLEDMNTLLAYLDATRRDRPESFPSFFELMTVLAMVSFRSSKVDWGIFEVGLGGRLDATNIVEPDWTVITSIGLEHTRQLGDTITKIAREKAGIIKQDTPLVLGDVERSAREVIEEIARERGAPIIRPPQDLIHRVGPRTLRIGGVAEEITAGAVLGPGLRANLRLAYALYEQLLATEDRAPRRETVETALRELRLPARVEVFDTEPVVILDGAHTTESIAALARTVDEIGISTPRTLIFSLANDKQVDAILDEIAKLRARDILLTTSDTVRSTPPEVLQAKLGRGQIVGEPEEALELARSIGHPILIAGSFYLAGRLRKQVLEG